MATETKPWYQSKTIISDVLTIALTVYVFVQHNFAPGLPVPPDGIVATIIGLLAGLGIFGRITTTTPIG